MKKQIIFYLIFLNIFIFNNSLAKTEFFQCSEKITDLRIGDGFLYKKGEIIGTNYIKLESTNVNPIISIHFRFKDNKNKPLKVIKNKDTSVLICKDGINTMINDYDVDRILSANATLGLCLWNH